MDVEAVNEVRAWAQIVARAHGAPPPDRADGDPRLLVDIPETAPEWVDGPLMRLLCVPAVVDHLPEMARRGVLAGIVLPGGRPETLRRITGDAAMLDRLAAALRTQPGLWPWAVEAAALAQGDSLPDDERLAEIVEHGAGDHPPLAALLALHATRSGSDEMLRDLAAEAVATAGAAPAPGAASARRPKRAAGRDARLSHEVDALRHERAKLEAEVRRLRAELVRARDAQNAAERTRDQAGTELSQTRANLADARERAGAHEARWMEAERVRDEARAERAELAARLQELSVDPPAGSTAWRSRVDRLVASLLADLAPRLRDGAPSAPDTEALAFAASWGRLRESLGGEPATQRPPRGRRAAPEPARTAAAVTALGGGNSLGASSYLVEWGGVRVLFDIGARPNVRRDAYLYDVPTVDAVLITHAHADHAGSWPVLASEQPTVPAFATKQTKRLLNLLLADAARVQHRAGRGAFGIEQAESAIGLLQVRDPIAPFNIADRRAEALLWPIAHLYGSCGLKVRTAEGVVAYSGDYFAVGGRALRDAPRPPLDDVDVLLLESTLGDRPRLPAEKEERRLLASLRRVAERDGTALLPVPAVGRAQELLLLLEDAMEEGMLPRRPIRVGGLVGRVTRECYAHPEEEGWGDFRWLRTNRFPPFHVLPPEAEASVDEVVGESCYVIAGGGVLRGQSMPIARALLGDPRHAICFTGSPGSALDEIRTGSALQLPDGETITVECEWGRFEIATHAGQPELVALAEQAPKATVVLVHGKPPAQAALAKRLRDLGREVVIAADGERTLARPPI